jgi:hypothetical protein
VNTYLHRHYEWVLFSFGYHGWAVGIILARLWGCNLLETSEEYFFTCQSFWDVGYQKCNVVKDGIWT